MRMMWHNRASGLSLALRLRPNAKNNPSALTWSVLDAAWKKPRPKRHLGMMIRGKILIIIIFKILVKVDISQYRCFWSKKYDHIRVLRQKPPLGTIFQKNRRGGVKRESTADYVRSFAVTTRRQAVRSFAVSTRRQAP